MSHEDQERRKEEMRRGGVEEGRSRGVEEEGKEEVWREEERTQEKMRGGGVKDRRSGGEEEGRGRSEEEKRGALAR